MEKAKIRYEEMAAGKCAVWYPIKEEVLPAEVITSIDTLYIEGETVYVDCDSIMKMTKPGSSDQSEPGKPGRVTVKCPPSQVIHRTDTIKTTIIKENTAALRAKSLEAERYMAGAVAARTWAIIGWVLAILLAIGLVFSIKSKNR